MYNIHIRGNLNIKAKVVLLHATVALGGEEV
jgi:hypothetical protein